MDNYGYKWEFVVDAYVVDDHGLSIIAGILYGIVGDLDALEAGWEKSENGEYQTMRLSGDVNTIVSAMKRLNTVYPGVVRWVKMYLKS